MDELKPIFLTESLFQPKNNYDEVKYSFVVDLFKKYSKILKDRFAKSNMCKNIPIYLHGFPHIYVISKRDYRGFPVYKATAPFRISDLSVKTGYGENIIINELIDICNEISADSTFVKINVYFSDSSREKVEVRIYLDNKCLPDLLSRKGSYKKIKQGEILNLINSNVKAIIKASKDDFIKPLTCNMNLSEAENHLYWICKGEVLIRQISLVSMYDGMFANLGLDCYQAGINFKYYLHSFYNFEDLTTYTLYLQGKCFVFVGNDNKSKIVS